MTFAREVKLSAGGDGTQANPTVPAYAHTAADYGASQRMRRVGTEGFQGALVVAVTPESPADDLGILPGMRILSVAGKPLTDMIVWLWEADGETAEIEVFDPRDGTVEMATLERFPGEDWGIEFDGAVFDGMRTCVNACIFCFMNMLPKESRASLSIRDDDYRLSFLQGNFVTLTNMTDAEVDDAIEKMLSPMNVSLHAITPACRRKLIGRNAARGIEVLERLLNAGIEVHAQIVLCPGINDGDELRATLEYVEAHPGITSLAIVPLGFTKHQKRFTASYSDSVEASRAVVRMLEPFQERARATRGATVFQLADEFYIDAELPVPATETYDGFPQFYDGIGMLRVFMDEVEEVRSARTDDITHVARTLADTGERVLVICGEAAESTYALFCNLFTMQDGESAAHEAHSSSGACSVSEARSGHAMHAVQTRAIKNNYFGGNVNVTGLICACDLLEQLPCDLTGTTLLIPEIIYNYDGLTLDGMSRADLETALQERSARILTCVSSPHLMLDTLKQAI